MRRAVGPGQGLALAPGAADVATCHAGWMDEQVRATLRAKEVELLAQMEQLSEPAQDQGSISFGKRVGDGTSMAVDRLTAVSAHENLQDVLDQVRHALARVDGGGYGVCEVCGEPIPEGRLEARPWATTCVAHSGR